MTDTEKPQAYGFDDGIYSGVNPTNESDLFPSANKSDEAVKEDVDSKKATAVAFMPAAKIINKVISNAKADALDLRSVAKSLSPPGERRETSVKDELRSRELYVIFLDGLEKTILAALAESKGGLNDG